MTTIYLLPNKFKKIGWILFMLTSLFTGYYLWHDMEPVLFNLKAFAFMTDTFITPPGGSFFTVIDDNIANEIIGVFGIVGCLFIAFSKEKNEDEFISKIRLDSLLWATYVNYAVLLVAIFFIYGIPFFWVLVLNMYTILGVFIIRFNWVNNKFQKSVSYEK